jgi:hypothetical protein
LIALGGRGGVGSHAEVVRAAATAQSCAGNAGGR